MRRSLFTRLSDRLRALVLLPVVFAVACAGLTAHLPHLPDGSLDVRTLVAWSAAGVEADCAVAPASSWCVLGRDVVANVTAAIDHDPTHQRTAAKAALTDSLTQWPSLKPVFGWLLADLD
jgi:hypothetical protein